MKNNKRFIGLLVAASLSLVIIPCAVIAQNNNSESLEDEYINLGKIGQHTIDSKVKIPDKTVTGVTIKKGDESVDGTVLSKTGDYAIQMTTSDVDYDYNVFCYRRGDANVDDECDVRDLVAAYRRDVHTQTSAGYGADMDGDTNVDETDYKLIRRMLVDQPLVLPEAGESADEHINISAVDLVDNEFTMTFENASKVWEVGKNSYIEYTFYDSTEAVLGTERVELGIVKPGDKVTCTVTLPNGTTDVQMTGTDFDYWSVIVK